MAASDIIRADWSDILIPSGGSQTIANTAAITGVCASSISVNSDTVIASCTGFDENGVAINFLTDTRYLWAGTLLAGSLKMCGKNRYISAITLTSGNIDLNKIK